MRMKLPFTKMHGAGNDFVVIDATRQPFHPVPGLLAHLGDRHFGVGCDQILVVEPASSPDVDFNYRIYNSDGSETGQCLNGSRCFARYVRERGLTDKDTICVQTTTSKMDLYLQPDGSVRVNAGVPRLEPAQVPMAADARALRYSLKLDSGETLEFGAASMGNPHAVMLVPDAGQAAVDRVGSALQAHAMFPQKVNAGFLQIKDSAHVVLRVYERGAGETLACGSGACAAVVVGRLWGKLAASVEVQMPGGILRIEWQGEGQPVWITGPAETVFIGEIEWQNS